MTNKTQPFELGRFYKGCQSCVLGINMGWHPCLKFHRPLQGCCYCRRFRCVASCCFYLAVSVYLLLLGSCFFVGRWVVLLVVGCLFCRLLVVCFVGCWLLLLLRLPNVVTKNTYTLCLPLVGTRHHDFWMATRAALHDVFWQSLGCEHGWQQLQ